MSAVTKKFPLSLPLPGDLIEELRQLEVEEVAYDLRGEEFPLEKRERLELLHQTQDRQTFTLICKKLTRGGYQNVLKNAEPNGDDALDSSLGYDTDVFGSLLIRSSVVALLDGEGEDVTSTQLDRVLDDTDGISMDAFMMVFHELVEWQKESGEESPNFWALSAF